MVYVHYIPENLSLYIRMHIAILWDVHDHRDNLWSFLDYIKNNDIDHIIHLWDYGAPFWCIKPILEMWIPVTGIWGNNDGENRGIMKLFENTPNCEIKRTVYGDTVLDSKKIFMVHFDNIHDTMARSGDYDLVLYGHNHVRDIHTIWETLVCNPWAICGNRESASFAVYDTQENEVRHVELDQL